MCYDLGTAIIELCMLHKALNSSQIIPNLSDEPKFTLLGSLHMAFQGTRCM